MSNLRVYLSKLFTPNFKILLFSILLFSIIFPLSNSISFYQNDDWVYYRVIKQFLTGNYDMPGYIEALFYTQGFLGTIFAKFFGVEKLPVLTLLTACISFFMLAIILNKFYLKNVFNSILVSLIMFVSPLFIYSTLGFMSEMYFILFLLLAFYFLESYQATTKKIDLVFFNISVIIGFFVRQLAIFSIVASVIVFIKNKKYKEALIQASVGILLFLAYTYIVPKTGTMKKHGVLYFENLYDYSFVITTIYIGLAYSTFFVLPYLSSLIRGSLGNKPSIIKISSFVFLTICLYLTTFFMVNPEHSDEPTMFYLKNTVNKEGFFYGRSLGQKYSILHSTEIYNYIELATKVSVAIFLASLIFLYKELINFYFVFAVIYIGFMLVLGGGLYDRYFLPLIPVTILFISSIDNKIHLISKSLIITFLFLVSFYSYNFAMDFVVLNNKMWEIGNKLYLEQNVAKDLVSAGNGWNRTYLSKTLRYKYVFFFGPRSEDKELSCCFKLKETIEVFYPFNFFKDPKIYLYKREF